MPVGLPDNELARESREVRQNVQDMKLGLSLAFVVSTMHGSQPAPRLTYSLKAQNGMLHVDLVIKRIGREIDLVIPTAWGDAVNLHRALTNFRALEGQISSTNDLTGTKRLQTVNGRARIAYDLVQDWTGVLRESVRHRPHVDASHFEINTANALIHPRLDLAQSVDCTFNWQLPVGWALTTTFGTTLTRGIEERQRFRGPWNDVAHAMFAGGDFRLLRSKIGRGELVTAIRGNFGFSDEEANDKIVKLMRLERAFWRDSDFRYFLVTLTPYGAGQSGSGGGGFTNAFNLYTSREGPFSNGLMSLLAHETFHTWNP